MGVQLLSITIAVICAFSAAPGAQEPAKLDRSILENGRQMLPLPWKPYRPATVPPADFRNGPKLVRAVDHGVLRLSQSEFLELVVENDLDVLKARYSSALALVDVLRAKSGQAARGTPLAPLPAGVFAGAIGAGVSTTAPLSSGGTGGAAISTQGRLVSFGPRGVFDPTLNVNLSYDRLVNPLNTTRVAGVRAVTVPSTVLQTRLQQELPEGTSYSVSFNLQRQLSNQTGLLFNPALSAFGSLQVYQPLLNGFGRPTTQRFTLLARNNIRITSEAFRSLLNDTLTQAAGAYWDLVTYRDNREVAAEAVSVAERQYRENIERVELGAMTQLDVLTAESQLAAARTDLIRADTQVQQQQIVVESMISRTPLDGVSIEPTEHSPSPTLVDLPPVSADITRALARRASVRQAEMVVSNQKAAQDYTRRNLLPVLSFLAQANIYALARGTPDAVKQLFRSEYPEYSVGISWSVPVFNRASMADYLRAQLETRQSEAALARTRAQVVIQVRNSSTAVAQANAAAVATARAVDASQAALEGEQVRLQYGVSTPFRVTQALRDLTAARAQDVQARATIAKALVAYQAAVGTLLEENGIDPDAAEAGNLFSGKP